MTPEELRAVAVEIFGHKAYIGQLGRALGISRAQAWRYLQGVGTIPGPVIAAVAGWLAAHREHGTIPPEQP